MWYSLLYLTIAITLDISLVTADSNIIIIIIIKFL